MPPKTANDDFEFIMTCLKHCDTKPKPDFNLVAKEIGAKNANAVYHRHWGIMKKWGLAGVSGAGRKPAGGSPASALGASATGVKRGRKPAANANQEQPKNAAKQHIERDCADSGNESGDGDDGVGDFEPPYKKKRVAEESRVSVKAEDQSESEGESEGS